jgi:hypothetical protein
MGFCSPQNIAQQLMEQVNALPWLTTALYCKCYATNFTSSPTWSSISTANILSSPRRTWSSRTGRSASILSINTRRDFSRDLCDGCAQERAPAARKSVTSLHATWFSVLRTALQYTAPGRVSAAQWMDALSAAMLPNRLECVPGSYRNRLICRRVIRLVGHIPVGVRSHREAGESEASRHRSREPSSATTAAEED